MDPYQLLQSIAAPDRLGARRAYSAAGCRELDRRASQIEGIAGFDLMQRAGRAAFNELLRRWPDAGSVSVYCGKGNNAGDGYIVAALARAHGFDVQLLQVGDPPAAGDAERAVALAASQGVIAESARQAARGAVIVDALLGTGIEGAPREPFASAIAHINSAGRPVLALDIPSGVGADTGAVVGAAVRADLTVSFIGRKIGLNTGPGLDCCGEIVHVTLGVSEAVFAAVPGCPLLAYAPGLLPARPVNAYKQSLGHLVIAGGDRAMGGAVLLAAEAALRTGVGLVSILTRPEHAPAVIARRPELMVRDATDEAAVEELLGRASAVVLGPGLGRAPWGVRLYERVLAAARPTLIDADGLRLLASNRARAPDQVIITPHSGEAAELLGSDNNSVNADRCGAASALAERVAGVAVLKGAGTVIAAPEGLVGIVTHGNPGMATAGMGDVLSGIAGGWLAQGLEPRAAAVLGATLHSAAGDLAASRVGRRSLLASDVTAAMIDLLHASG